MHTRRSKALPALMVSAAIAGCGGGGGSTTGSRSGTQTGGGASKPTGGPLYEKAVKECFEQANQLPAGPDREQANQDCREAAD